MEKYAFGLEKLRHPLNQSDAKSVKQSTSPAIFVPQISVFLLFHDRGKRN